MENKTELIRRSLFMLEQMGYNTTQDIIEKQESFFVVKGYIDGDKDYVCFKGIAFLTTKQINISTKLPGNFYVLDFNQECNEDCVDDKTGEVVSVKKNRFSFLSTEFRKIDEVRDKDKIIGNIICSEKSLQDKNYKYLYSLEFTPTKESVFHIKTEEIFMIIDDFKDKFKSV